MQKSIRIAMLMAVLLPLQGCLGVGAWTLGSRTESSDRPTINQARGSFDLRSSERPGLHASASDLRAGWGEPDQVLARPDGKEEWTYKTDGLRWSGLVLFVVVIPLPAMVPVGSQYVSFVIHDGRVESATRGDWAFKAGAYCGFFGMTYGGLGCGTGTFERVQGPPHTS